MDAVRTLFIIAYVIINFLLITNLWSKQTKGSMTKKIVWTFIILVPVFGWICYGSIYEPPSKNKPTGSTPASGWATHLPKE